MATDPNDELDRLDMERLCRGHDAALNDLMERHGTRLFHYLIRQLQNEADAEDVVQDAFVRVFQHRQRYVPRHRFSTWLFTIATNLARDRQRWRKRHPHVSVEAEDETTSHGLKDTLPSGSAGPGDSLVADERGQAVRAAIAGLPEDLRTVILLFEYEEQSQQEIASILKCTPKAVEMKLYRARHQLRERLSGLL
ncbi:MAG TPA: RNA polymerase sigma factor [Verrucomicrobiota bacterium]|nr:RNA polymerase sigma factor [Verrucomicrobiota bacterium]